MSEERPRMGELVVRVLGMNSELILRVQPEEEGTVIYVLVKESS